MSVLVIAFDEDLVERVAERAQLEGKSVREYAAEALEAHLAWAKITPETEIKAGSRVRDPHGRMVYAELPERDDLNGWELKT